MGIQTDLDRLLVGGHMEVSILSIPLACARGRCRGMGIQTWPRCDSIQPFAVSFNPLNRGMGIQTLRP
jgi:hypothetical protein